MIDDGYDQDFDGPQSFDPVAHTLRLVRDPVGVVRRRWIWMVAATALCAVGTVAFVATLVPTYVATARVVLSGQQIPEDFVRSTVREGSLENINAMLGEILSRSNLAKLIERHQLYAEEHDELTRNALVGKLRSSVVIGPEKIVASRKDRSEIYSVSFEYTEPVAAAAVANDLASIFVESSIARRNRQARTTTEFLERELERAEGELRQINDEITAFRRANRGELPGDLDPALAKLERLSTRRQALALELSEREERLLILSGVKGETASTETQQQLQELRRELTRELSVHTEMHPNVVALRDRIARLEAMAVGEEPMEADPDPMRRLRIAGEETELQRIKKEIALLDGQMAEIDDRVDRIPTNEEALNALLQRADVLRGNYLEFLRKVQAAELAETLESTQQGPQVSILDRAQVPGAPAQSRVLFLLLGLVVSLGAGIGLGFGLELLDPVVLDGQQLEALSGEPFLGSVPTL